MTEVNVSASFKPKERQTVVTEESHSVTVRVDGKYYYRMEALARDIDRPVGELMAEAMADLLAKYSVYGDDLVIPPLSRY